MCLCLILLLLTLSEAYITPVRVPSKQLEFFKWRACSRSYALGSESLASVTRDFKAPSARLLDSMKSKLSHPYRITANDASSISGLSLEEAKENLMLLSSITGGVIEVSEDGDLIYSFTEDFEKVLNKQNLGIKVRKFKQTVGPPLGYLTRVSFGIMLLTSLTVIVSTIALASSSSSSSGSSGRSRSSGSRSSNDDNDGRAGVSINLNGLFAENLFDYFLYRPRYGYYGYGGYPRYGYGYDYPVPRSNDPKRVTFIESFFSFVFGEGDPNVNFNDIRLQHIAEMICQRDGIVLAEDLAPYMDPSVSPLVLNTNKRVVDENGKQVSDLLTMHKEGVAMVYAPDSTVEESWVLPAILQFGGTPEVTPKGNIFYRFDNLRKQNSLSTIQSQPRDGTTARRFTEEGSYFLPGFMEEKPMVFSKASTGQQLLAGALGAVNFGGILTIGRMMSATRSLGTRPNMYLMALSNSFPLLLVYACLYVVIPLYRSVQITKRNEEIKKNNLYRRLWSRFRGQDSTIKDHDTRSSETGYSLSEYNDIDGSVVFDNTAVAEYSAKRKDVESFAKSKDFESKRSNTGQRAAPIAYTTTDDLQAPP